MPAICGRAARRDHPFHVVARGTARATAQRDHTVKVDALAGDIWDDYAAEREREPHSAELDGDS